MSRPRCEYGGPPQCMFDPETCARCNPAAPAAEADLRADLMKWLSLRVGGLCWDEAPWQEWSTEADELLALPALQRLVAEAAEARRLREQLREVEAELRELAGAALRSGKH